jgi:hypothetical protein
LLNSQQPLKLHQADFWRARNPEQRREGDGGEAEAAQPELMIQNCPPRQAEIHNSQNLTIGAEFIFTLRNRSACLRAHNPSGVMPSGFAVLDALINFKVIENLPLSERILPRNQLARPGNLFADHDEDNHCLGGRQITSVGRKITSSHAALVFTSSSIGAVCRLLNRWYSHCSMARALAHILVVCDCIPAR